MLKFFQRKLKYLKNPKLLTFLLINKIINKFDIYKYKYFRQRIYRETVKITQNCQGLISPIVAIYLYKTVIKNRRIPGYILDFGSYKGLSTSILSRAAARIQKNVIAFESFQGLPPPTIEDNDSFRVGEYRASLKEFLNNVSKFGIPENIKLIEGDIRKTLKEEISSKRILNYSFAFLDLDLYISTKDTLFLLNNISKGGEIICVHDIYSPGIQRALKEFMSSWGNRVSIRYRPAIGSELIIKSQKWK